MAMQLQEENVYFVGACLRLLAGAEPEGHAEIVPAALRVLQAAQAAAAEPMGQQSPLLRCLSQLNDDVLTAHLLPKILEQGSASAVFCTCSHLRKLLQPSIQHLDLTKQLQDADNPCHSPGLAMQLGLAFPNSTSLDFAWASKNMAKVQRNIGLLLAGCVQAVAGCMAW
jgi:hypothetical protein